MIARLLPVRTALAVTRSSPRITLNTGQIRGLTELHAGQPSAEALPLTEAPVPRLKYAVPRNTKGSLPVYTDYRAGHRKVEVQIRNIDGDARVRILSSSSPILQSLTRPILISRTLHATSRPPCFPQIQLTRNASRFAYSIADT